MSRFKLTSTHTGILTALVMAALTVYANKSLGQDINGPYNLWTMGIFIIGVILAVYLYMVKHGRQSFKLLFQEGFKAFITCTFLMLVFSWFFLKANPQVWEHKLEENNEMLRAEGKRTEQEIAANAEKLKDIFFPMMLSITTFKYLLAGGITAALTAAALQASKKTVA